MNCLWCSLSQIIFFWLLFVAMLVLACWWCQQNMVWQENHQKKLSHFLKAKKKSGVSVSGRGPDGLLPPCLHPPRREFLGIDTRGVSFRLWTPRRSKQGFTSSATLCETARAEFYPCCTTSSLVCRAFEHRQRWVSKRLWEGGRADVWACGSTAQLTLTCACKYSVHTLQWHVCVQQQVQSDNSRAHKSMNSAATPSKKHI